MRGHACGAPLPVDVDVDVVYAILFIALALPIGAGVLSVVTAIVGVFVFSTLFVWGLLFERLGWPGLLNFLREIADEVDIR